MSNTKKCTNPACSCIPADKEKYCSPHCEALGKATEIVCKCGHPHCAGEVS